MTTSIDKKKNRPFAWTKTVKYINFNKLFQGYVTIPNLKSIVVHFA
jgi:hypothetical protein